MASAVHHNAYMHASKEQETARSIIKRLLAEREMNPTALAREVGLPQPTVSRFLKGDSKTMEVENFQAIAMFFGLTLSELLGEVPIGARGDLRDIHRIGSMLSAEKRSTWARIGRALLEDE